MKSGYDNLVWVNDKKGKQYVCNLESGRKRRHFEDLRDEEKNRCTNVNQIVGTERW